MRIHAFILAVLFHSAFLLIPAAYAQTSHPPVRECRYCPPAYCEDPALAKRLKEEKKADARMRGLPERLLKIFDELPDCRGCIASAPDWITIGYSVDREEYKKQQGRDPGYNRRWMPWSRDMEKRLRDDMRKGLVKEIHFLHYTGVCECCPDTSESAYRNWRETRGQVPEGSDFQEEFEYDPQHGFGITSPGQLGADPADLTEIPDNNKRSNAVQLPPVADLMDPGVRIVHVMCPACSGLADQYNELGRKVEALRRPIAQARREIILMRNVIDDVWSEMAGLGLTAQTAEREKKDKELNDELSTRQQQLSKAQQKLSAMLKERAELQAEMDLLLEKIKECEANCNETQTTPQQDDSQTAPSEEKEEHTKTGTETKKETLKTAAQTTKKGSKCAVPSAKSIKIGPNGEYGTGAQMKNKVKGAATGAAMGALGSVLGGSGISLGGGGASVGSPMGGSGSKGPKTEKDPVAGEFVHLEQDGIDLGVKAGFAKGGLTVSQKIFSSPGDNSTFHAVWMEDGSGRVKTPKGYFIIGLYVDHKLTLWWTYDHWTNGVHDAHDEGSETTTWRTSANLRQRLEGIQGVENSIWYQSGFDTAVKGVKHIGAVFDVGPEELAGDCPLNLVTHMTMPDQEPDIGTTPFVSQLSIDAAASDGKSLTDIKIDVKPAAD